MNANAFAVNDNDSITGREGDNEVISQLVIVQLIQ